MPKNKKHEWFIVGVDGTIVERDDEPTLERLQEAVGGYIELVPDFKKFEGRRCVAYFNEEGRLKPIKANPKGTLMWTEVVGFMTPTIYGPLVVVYK